MRHAEGLTVERDDLPVPGARLMARDGEAFARAEAAGGCAPRLSWFRWDRPTLSLGRGQDPSTVDAARAAADGVPVVVRPTGGRAVFHVDEWTYAALVPLSHPTLGGSLAASCRAIVALVAAALERAYGLAADTGVARGVAAGPAGGIDRAACFGRAFGHELVIGGRKLMGSAQRRGRHVLLQQGSLLVGPGQERVLRYLVGPNPPLDDASWSRAEADLAAGTTHLAALLGRRPEPEAFFVALAEEADALQPGGSGARLS